jgi:hypothetical protein
MDGCSHLSDPHLSAGSAAGLPRRADRSLPPCPTHKSRSPPARSWRHRSIITLPGPTCAPNGRCNTASNHMQQAPHLRVLSIATSTQSSMRPPTIAAYSSPTIHGPQILVNRSDVSRFIPQGSFIAQCWTRPARRRALWSAVQSGVGITPSVWLARQPPAAPCSAS